MCYSALVEQDIRILRANFDPNIDAFGFEAFRAWSEQDPKRFKNILDNPRIYPFYYASIIARGQKGLVCAPMRYQLWPSGYQDDPRNLSLYNARLDSIARSTIWGRLFMRQHGLVTIKKFYEWVAVRDLIQAGQVSLQEVKDEFARQSEARRRRLELLGKAYAPTKTEQMEPLERKTIISFSVSPDRMLFVPVLFDYHRDNMGRNLGSFAIITTDPTPEIERAGHDRRPIFFLDKTLAKQFIEQDISQRQMLDLLNRPPQASVTHRLERLP